MEETHTGTQPERGEGSQPDAAPGPDRTQGKGGSLENKRVLEPSTAARELAGEREGEGAGMALPAGDRAPREGVSVERFLRAMSLDRSRTP
jgi:hypothetical protein